MSKPRRNRKEIENDILAVCREPISISRIYQAVNTNQSIAKPIIKELVAKGKLVKGLSETSDDGKRYKKGIVVFSTRA